LEKFLHPNKPSRTVFVSLCLGPTTVSACAWTPVYDGSVTILASKEESGFADTWKERTIACDTVITALEEKIHEGTLSTVVLGLTPEYVTEAGDVVKEYRGNIKELVTELMLKPAGYLPVSSAVVYRIKREEGVPPNVLIFWIEGKEMVIHLYTQGTLVGIRKTAITEFISEDVEMALKAFPHTESFPSRMMLLGSNIQQLEQIKHDLLKNQWTTRANFVHFPTIDILLFSDVAYAVAIAGASELAAQIPPEETTEQSGTGAVSPSTTAFAQPKIEEEEIVSENKKENETDDEKDFDDEEEDDDEEDDEKEDDLKQVVSNKKDTEPEDDSDEEKDFDDEDDKDEMKSVHEIEGDLTAAANVIAVPPETLGFGKPAILSEKPRPQRENTFSESSEEKKESIVSHFFSSVSRMFQRKTPHVSQIEFSPSRSRFPLLMTIIGIAVIMSIIGGILFLYPSAKVTISVIPSTVTKEQAITISSTDTGVDTVKFRIPGMKLEKSISGEKVLAVTGKKKIGDPGKGAIVIYNKATTERSVKKGTTLTTGSLVFTLDADVLVASATESLSMGQITFGKTTAAVTAVAIGEEGNISSGKEFIFKDIFSSILVARNDQPFSGGTSRQATVVTRADMDNLVKVASEELVAKAKDELLAQVEGGQQLLDETIVTKVTEKSFTEELDQEAQNIHGKVTISVSGMSYKTDDIKTLLLALAQSDIPSGYVTSEGRTTMGMKNPSVKKDGTISATATIALTALPIIDSEKIKSELRGKSLKDAENLIRQVPGAGAVQFFFTRKLFPNQLPLVSSNISVNVAVME